MLSTTAQSASMMAAFCLIFPSFTHGGSTKAVPNTTQPDKRIYDFTITPEMKISDFDKPDSLLSKLIKFVVKGPNKTDTYASFVRKGKVPQVQLSIDDSSVFVPGEVEANKQSGFRRTDFVTGLDTKQAFSGTTTFYQTIAFDPKVPLALKHEYLLASIETPTGAHVYDVSAGAPFDSSQTDPAKIEPNSTIRVRDFNGKSLYETKLDPTMSYNFATTVDWTAKTLAVYASTNEDPLKKVAEPTKNAVTQLSAEDLEKTEFHIQLIKFPLPDAAVPFKQRGDVPHVGLQEKFKKEVVLFSNVYVTSGTDIQQPSFGKQPTRHSRCRQ